MDLLKPDLRSMMRETIMSMMRETFHCARPKLRIAALAAAAGWALVLSLGTTAMPLQTMPVQTKTASHEKPDWEDKIVQGSQLTVLELARRILPDLKRDQVKADKITASDLSGIRLLDGVKETGMELDPDATDEREIAEPDYFWMKDGGDRFLLLLLKVDSEQVVIGLFRVASEITLLDAVTIAQDMHVDVNMEKLWAIHPQHQAFSVECWHDNSSESFDNYTFVSVVDRKLRAVAGPILTSGFATYLASRQQLCKTSVTPKFEFVPSQDSGYFDLLVTETTLKVCHRDSEEWSWKTGVVFNKSVRRLWRWNPKNKQYRISSPGGR